MKAQYLTRAEATLAELEAENSVPTRLDRISASLMGLPYADGPLDPPGATESLRVSFESFDCVTYVETVLALAQSTSVERFLDLLPRIRYQGGEVSWMRRNHYMIEWARNNEAARLIEDITTGSNSVERTRTLTYIKELPARTVTFRLFPKRKLPGVSGLIETGDLILFISTKRRLDAFHTGFLFRTSDRIALRHASKRAGGVVEQELDEFIRANRMSGFVLLRPSRLLV
jgi:hypothetical protein